MLVDISYSILFCKHLKLFYGQDLRKQVAFSRVLTTGALAVYNVRLNLIQGALLVIYELLKTFITGTHIVARALHCCGWRKVPV